MDATLRMTARTAPDTEQHAAQLRRAGQAAAAGRIYRALADAARERLEDLRVAALCSSATCGPAVQEQLREARATRADARRLGGLARRCAA